MSVYIVFVCPRCGSIRYAKKGQSIAKCFECSYRIMLNRQKIRILLETMKAQDAVEAVKRYKMRLKKASYEKNRNDNANFFILN